MVKLETSALALFIDPSHGGAITSLQSAKFHDEWIFFDKSRRPRHASLENYDDVWCGGFEELFPNDAPGVFLDMDLKDHGELWQREWDIVHRSETGVTLELQCETTPATVQKTVSVNSRQTEIHIDYSLKNTGDKTYPYLFKLHPAMRIEPGDQILLPDGDVVPVDMKFSKIIADSGPFRWPEIPSNPHSPIDLSIIPAREKNLQEFVYIKNMTEGWCGVKRKQTGEKFIIHYPPKTFPFCWLFMALGGWKNYYTVVLEPCTNFPKDMHTALADGTCAIMQPFETKRFSITISLTE